MKKSRKNIQTDQDRFVGEVIAEKPRKDTSLVKRYGAKRRSSAKPETIGETYDGIKILRPHMPPRNVELKVLRRVIKELKQAAGV